MIKIQPFTFWEVLKTNHIQIPDLQRDYAQGRNDDRSKDIREKFVKAMADSLRKNEKLHLDFVYGTREQSNAGAFIPVDGQQRLTTLFLLHYYFCPENQRILRKFSYATRPTSAAFCSELVAHSLIRQENPSLEIKDTKWYNSEWHFDPTITGMLTMLDAIHDEFKKDLVPRDFWKKLTEGELITFDFLDMNQVGLSSDLYIKMNSRGKQLTDWENFKADFEKYIDDQTEWNESVKGWNSGEKDWKELMDTEWTDIFWKNKDKENMLVDEEWMRFFRVMAMIFYAKDLNEKPVNKIFEKFQSQGTDAYFSITDFIQIERVDEDSNDKTEKQKLNLLEEKNVGFLFESLQKLKKLDEFEALVDSLFQIKQEDKFHRIFRRNLDKSATYNDRVYFFVLLKALFIFDDLETEGNVRECKRWFRIWRNLIENSTINASNFANVIRSIDQFSDSTAIGFYRNFIDLQELIIGFDANQKREEIRKVQLILNETDLVDQEEMEALFLIAENNEIFQGQIHFLLEMSKENEISINKKEFKKFSENSNLIFSPAFVKDSELIVHRGFLTVIDYAYPRNGNKWTYGHFNTGWNSWKKVLAYNTKENLDSLKSFILNIENEVAEVYLRRLIYDFVAKNPNDYRVFLVQNPRLLNKSVLKQITWSDSDDQPIDVLFKDYLSGEHREFFTFGLYEEIRERRENDSSFLQSFNTVYHEGQYATRAEKGSYLVLKIKRNDIPILEAWIHYEKEHYLNGNYFELTFKLLPQYSSILSPFFKSRNSNFGKWIDSEGRILTESLESHLGVFQSLQEVSDEVVRLKI